MAEINLQNEMQRIDAVIAKGPFQDTWESLSAYQVKVLYFPQM